MTDVSRITAATQPRNATTQGGDEHVVRRGDSLWSIARQHGVSLSELEAANPSLARNDFIFPGDRIALPGRGGSDHLVRPGETVSGIAARHGVSVDAIVDANHLTRPDLIHPGDRLTIPNRPDRPAAPTATVAAQTPASGGTDLRALFDPALGSRAPGAVIIGQAEGTRSPDGGFRPGYYGHTDPGNGAANRGSFSLQNAGTLTPDQADARQLARLGERIPAFETAARTAGLDPNDATLATGYLDLYNQSPTAAARFLDQIGTLREAGVTRQSVTDLRVHSYVDRDTGERFALSSGGRAGSGFVTIARNALGREPTEAEVQRTIRADQTRRMDAMGAAIDRMGQAPAPVPSAAPAAPARPGAIDTVLPATGTGYVTYNREAGGADQVGTADFVARLQQVGRDWAAAGHPPMQIGDLSRAGGGRFAPHSAHQRGTEADIRPFGSDGRQGPMRWDSPGYDRATTRALVETIRARHPDATILFNDPQLVREGLVRAYVGHDNHLHVRF